MPRIRPRVSRYADGGASRQGSCSSPIEKEAAKAIDASTSVIGKNFKGRCMILPPWHANDIMSLE